MDYISAKELCKILSISAATGKNWVKLGKLKPEYTEKGTPYFSKTYAETLKKELQSGKNTALKSRRNKKYISGNSFYNSYVSDKCQNINTLQNILKMAKETCIDFTADVIQYLIADCALQLLAQKNNYVFKNKKSLLLKYLSGNIKLNAHNELIDSLITNPKNAILFCKQHPQFFELDYTYEPNEDILGLIYISCKNIGSRKATGSYYTPTKIVKKLISKLEIKANDKILDPCCGTGNFLLQLPEIIPFEKVYGNDLDQISVNITRLNMALKYNNLPSSIIVKHITKKNFLTDYQEDNFQYIIGNPPWGYEFSEDEKSLLKKIYKATSGKNIESYDVFIEKALQSLSVGGQLSYVLPEAILNVKAHKNIRRIIMENNSIKSLEFLGNTFDRVQCPCIILQLIHTNMPLSTKGMRICNSNKIITTEINRTISSENFNFLTTDDEYRVLEKIKNNPCVKYLRKNADFALGIVTGNNKKYISNQKTNDNEMILKGTDIHKYRTTSTDNYIIFKPDKFQQVAPVEMYRAPEKLLYKFISNQLVFAYDDKQTLTLNSCNIVIPKLKGAKIKYILAILNSRIAQFIYKMDFHSVKVLRSHIESIPIPIIDENRQNIIIELVDKLIDGLPSENIQLTYNILDNIIFDIFNLNKTEQEIIINALDKK